MKIKLHGIIAGLFIALLFFGMPVLAKPADVLLNTVNIKVNGILVTTIGENYKMQDGTQVPFSILYNGTTYLPLRKISEITDKVIDYDRVTKTVTLNDKVETAAEPANTSGPKAVQDLKNILLSSYKTFSGAISIIPIENGGHAVKLDRNALPESMKNFSKISAVGINSNSDNDISIILYGEVIKCMRSYEYDEASGFKSGNRNPYEMVILYDSTDEILGYQIIRMR